MAPAVPDEETTDLLVIGSGAAGLTAALVARLHGLSVIVCEKAPHLGGTSATSGGAIWIAASSQAARAGYCDSIEQGRTYLRFETGEHAREDLIDAFLQSGPAMVDLLEQHTEVLFDPVPVPDYHAESPGGVTAGRVLIARPFDGRRLGADFRRLAAPMPRLMVLGGMMVGFAEIPMLLRPLQSWAALRLVARNLGRYALDRLHHPRGTRLLNGNALMARLLASLRQHHVDIRTGTSLLELLAEGARVGGAVFQCGTGRKTIRARRAVVLATGGAAQDGALRQDLMRDFPHRAVVAQQHSTGDGVHAALAAGGQIDRHVSSPAVWTPASVLRESDGSTTVFPYGYLDRGKPGAIAVNSAGQRFVNEALSYHDVVQAMYRDAPSGVVPRAHLVCDSAFVRRYGLGMIRPHDPTLSAYVRRGYVLRADTLEELATRIGADAHQLLATVARHNAFAGTGVDLDFGKGSTAFNRANGDPSVGPNPNLRAIGQPPFFALPITPATLGVSIGLKTNADAQVLNLHDDPIAGLYACGNDTSSVMRGYCPGGGVTLGPAMVFAYRAAQHAAGTPAAPVSTSGE